MCFDMLKLCRLCMSTLHLKNIYPLDEDTKIDTIISFCINIKVQPGDGLPAVICSDCLDKIYMFNIYKQTCLEVDLKLKLMLEKSKHVLDKTNQINIQKISESNEKNIESNDIIFPDKLCDINSKICNNETNTIKVWNKKINKSNNSYQCDQCGRVFKMKTFLEKHMLIHSGIKPFICKFCPKTYTRAENRMIHMRSHLGIKQYVCEICGSASTKRQDLIRHMKVHSDERKYSCSVCNRSFKRSNDLNSHMRTHTGLRPYECNICEKTYTSHSGLRKHYKSYCKKNPILSKLKN